MLNVLFPSTSEAINEVVILLSSVALPKATTLSVGASFTGVTIISISLVTVAPLVSVVDTLKLSIPLKFEYGAYKILPSSIATFPFVVLDSILNTKFISSISASVILKLTVPLLSSYKVIFESILITGISFILTLTTAVDIFPSASSAYIVRLIVVVTFVSTSLIFSFGVKVKFCIKFCIVLILPSIDDVEIIPV